MLLTIFIATLAFAWLVFFLTAFCPMRAARIRAEMTEMEEEQGASALNQRTSRV